MGWQTLSDTYSFSCQVLGLFFPSLYIMASCANILIHYYRLIAKASSLLVRFNPAVIVYHHQIIILTDGDIYITVGSY